MAQPQLSLSVLIAVDSNDVESIGTIGYRFPQDAENAAIELNNADHARGIYWRAMHIQLTAIE